MKKVLVFALIAVFALSLSSCGKKNEEKTKTQLLCIDKGWKLESAQAAPYYTPSEGQPYTDLYQNYFNEWELDDIIVFNTNGSQVIKPGNKKPTSDDQAGYTEEKASTWGFSPDESTLFFQIPFFYEDKVPARTFDEEFESALVDISETKLVITYTYNVEENPSSKEICTFTLTYVPANK